MSNNASNDFMHMQQMIMQDECKNLLLFCSSDEIADIQFCDAINHTLQIKYASKHSHVLHLKLFNLKINHIVMSEVLVEINQYDFIVLPSPKAIQIFVAQLNLADILAGVTDNIKLCVVGLSSYNLLSGLLKSAITNLSQSVIKTQQEILQTKISKLIKNTIYPLMASGINALFQEYLHLYIAQNKRVLLLKGTSGSNTLEHLYLDNQAIKLLTTRIIYTHDKIIIDKKDLDTLFMNLITYTKGDKKLNGIIITSSIYLDYLLELLMLCDNDQHSLYNFLINQRFFTIHDKIATKLLQIGVKQSNIKISTKANKYSILGDL